MSNLALISTHCPKWTTRTSLGLGYKFVPQLSRVNPSRRRTTTAFFCTPPQEPIIKEAIKEPVAFLGGVFAGLLRLDLREEPLKEWIYRTVEASGITEQDIDIQGPESEEEPQQIDIE